jgi:hypothetical protein
LGFIRKKAILSFFYKNATGYGTGRKNEVWKYDKEANFLTATNENLENSCSLQWEVHLGSLIIKCARKVNARMPASLRIEESSPFDF